MEAVAGYSEISEDVLEAAKQYIKDAGLTITELAKMANTSRSDLSKYFNRNRYFKPAKVEKQLMEVLDEQGYAPDRQVQLATVEQTPAIAGPAKKDFYKSMDAANVLGVCAAAQEHAGLGVVVGRTGFGKTHTLKHYAKLSKTVLLECDDTMGCKDLVEDVERALGIPVTYGTISRKTQGIKEFFAVHTGYLVLIDEADKLISKYTQKKMEILRTIFDQAKVGLVIAGEPKLEALIKGYLPRFANRVDFYAMLGGLSEREVRGYLAGFDINDDALAVLVERGTDKRAGCFRLLNRTLSNAIRLMHEAGSRRITLKIIKKASNMMML